MVVPLEHDHLQVTLIEPGRLLDDLIPIGLTNRPELAGHQAAVQATIALLRREKMRPVLPSILINGFQTPNELIQAGIFGMGPNNKMNQWVGRDDVSLQPLWQLEGMGIGNLARIKEARGMESLAIIELFRTQDMVAADVTRAHARLQSAALRVIQADRRPAHGHHHLQRQLPGPAADDTLRRRPGPGQPPAGGGLRPPAHEARVRRVLHHGGRLQPGRVRAIPRARATPPRSSRSASRRAPSSRSTWRGRTTCPRWATARPRRPAEDSRRPDDAVRGPERAPGPRLDAGANPAGLPTVQESYRVFSSRSRRELHSCHAARS